MVDEKSTWRQTLWRSANSNLAGIPYIMTWIPIVGLAHQKKNYQLHAKLNVRQWKKPQKQSVRLLLTLLSLMVYMTESQRAGAEPLHQKYPERLAGNHPSLKEKVPTKLTMKRRR